MKLLITGSPGVGKTTLARMLAEALGCSLLNEKDVALEAGIGSWNHEDGELEISPEELAHVTNARLEAVKDAVVEGHLYCEARVAVDAVAVVRVHPEELELRLEARNYPGVKVQDNVFCEGIDYCLKHAKRAYKGLPVFEVYNQGGPPEMAMEKILKELHALSLKVKE